MCPVAPKMSHVFCVAGLVSLGGSVAAGRWSLGLAARRVVGERTVGLLMSWRIVGGWRGEWRVGDMSPGGSKGVIGLGSRVFGCFGRVKCGGSEAATTSRLRDLLFLHIYIPNIEHNLIIKEVGKDGASIATITSSPSPPSPCPRRSSKQPKVLFPSPSIIT